MQTYPAPDDDETPDPNAILAPMRLRSEAGELAFLGTTTVFGTPVEVTLSELAIESLFPADSKTSKVMRAMSPVGRVPRFKLPPLK